MNADELLLHIIAVRLMMIRRGNPDMGGPNWSDQNNAKELIEELKGSGYRIVRLIPESEITAWPEEEIESP